MTISTKTKIAILYMAPIIFGLMAGDALYVALTEPTRAHIAQAVLWFSLCITFLSIARMAHKRHGSQQGDSSSEPQ